jgi:hypothetical protein
MTSPAYDENAVVPESLWFGDIKASFKVFRTRGGKFLIWASTDAGDLNSSNLGLNSLVPGVADYAILEELKGDLKTIRTENYGIEFELPKDLIQNAKKAFKKQRPVKHLNI